MQEISHIKNKKKKGRFVCMSDKDELLKAQKAEIEKLKKELQEATKPSSLCSVIQVIQKSIKRNIHNFFFREDKMKDMDVKIKELQKGYDFSYMIK